MSYKYVTLKKEHFITTVTLNNPLSKYIIFFLYRRIAITISGTGRR
ncbi:hypothetical protein QKW52_24005 [Bacillus sonorensis]|nr:hypothetical protein [Bacillus sonorensis]